MSYVRIWVHLIWSTKNRRPILSNELRDKITTHIEMNAKAKNIFLDCIGGHLEHIHALLSLRSDLSIATIAQMIKGESSHWVNALKLVPFKFEWQTEYYALSVSESAIDIIRRYIKDQEEHHRRKTFAEEFEEIIDEYTARYGGLKPKSSSSTPSTAFRQ